MCKDKIRPLEEMSDIAFRYRTNGQIVVATNGSFDILHLGHVRALQESKKQGEILIVGIDSDESIMRRKSGRPIYDENYRSEMLAHIPYVDYVTIFEDSITFVEKIKPKVYTNGPDYGENCIEKETVEKYGGRVYIYKHHKDKNGRLISTSNLISKLVESQKLLKGER